MDHLIRQFLKESIELELNIGDIYQLFSAKFPPDYTFWWKISIEELNHAALIESINDIFWDESILPLKSIEKQTEDLRKMNLYIKNRIEQYKAVPPTRSEAFKLGFELENSVGESHFELFMTSASDSPVIKIFQKLNGDDISHAKRMASYMKENGIEVL
jgi:ferritin